MIKFSNLMSPCSAKKYIGFTMATALFWITFLFSAFFSVTVSSTAYAQQSIAIIDVIGASNYDRSSRKIWGGYAGTTSNPADGNCFGYTGTSTCNNCRTNGDLTACNTKTFVATTLLRISFEITGDITGAVLALYKSGTTTAELPLTGKTTGTLSKGDKGFIETSWRTLCTSVLGGCSGGLNTADIIICLSDSSTCDTQKSVTLPIAAVDAPDQNPHTGGASCGTPAVGNNGICKFRAFPGDEKVFIREPSDDSTLVTDGGWPNNANAPIKKVRIFFNNTGFTTLNNRSESVDLDIKSNGELEQDRILGLENGTPFYFRAGVVDEAGNLFHVISNTQIDNLCGDHTAPAANCTFVATPSEVYGLLEKDLNCFISTAAYGSQWHSKVQDFRKFRNQVLLRNSWGLKLNQWYYQQGPKAARWLDENSWAKPFARAALWPFWAITQAFNKFNKKDKTE